MLLIERLHSLKHQVADILLADKRMLIVIFTITLLPP